ncbi:MAG: hypothetical protein JWR80_2899 [Bradyrhizobium sp.]|nr:hypothetical protein [Bradyrhizobium sp.]
MASNKNQHFVPRAHFRTFSIDSDGKAINLFNLDRGQAIAGAPLKGQCSGDYFYGEDLVVERALQAFEGRYATMVASMQVDGYRLTDEHRAQLRDFWCLQHLRTEQAARRQVELMAEMGDIVGMPGNRFRMTIREAVRGAIELYDLVRPALNDLKICLVRNATDLAFLTSDDPAVATNRWHLQDPRPRGMAPGLVSAGALMLLPLAPDLLGLIYDGDVYAVPHKEGWIVADRRADIASFNQHQVLNCFANLYFQDWGSRHVVEIAAREAVARRPAARHRINYAVFDHQEGDDTIFRAVDPRAAPAHERAMIHHEAILPIPSSWPRQIGWRPDGRVYFNGTGTGFVRHSRIAIDGGPAYDRIAARRLKR